MNHAEVIYEEIYNAACMGKVCPSNHALAKAINRDRYVAAGYVYRMKRDGIFRVEGNHGYRVVHFEDGLSTISPEEHIQDMAEKAAVIFDCHYDNIMGHRRFREFIRPRQAVCLVADDAGYSSEAIGKAIGRDHSSVLNLISVGNEIMRRDSEFASKIGELRYSSGLCQHGEERLV